MQAEQIQDADIWALFDCFDEKQGSRIIDVGCHDESAQAAEILVDRGFRVTGIDLRTPENFKFDYLRHDFCNLPPAFLAENTNKIDSIISISAIEHFGLSTYDEGSVNLDYDIYAMRQIWQLLREGGTTYISVPFGSTFKTVIPHWRIYDLQNLTRRIVQDFRVVRHGYFFSGPAVFDGRAWRRGQWLQEHKAMQYDSDVPHLTVFLKLEKQRCQRIAPDGR